MKTLSIKQPWATLIAANIKKIENRTWATKYRGRIYIHCSSPKKFNVSLTDPQMIAAFPLLKDMMSGELPFGAIIGEVDIVDCVLNHPSVWAEHSAIVLRKGNEVEVPVYNWVLANPVLYDQPI